VSVTRLLLCTAWNQETEALFRWDFFTADEIQEILHRADLKKFSDGDMVVQEETPVSIYLIKAAEHLSSATFWQGNSPDTLCAGSLRRVAFLTGGQGQQMYLQR
jgi:hypothetical protein